MPRKTAKSRKDQGDLARGEGQSGQSEYPLVSVVIAMFSRAYRNLAAQQYAEGLVNHKGDLLVDNRVLKKNEVYQLPRSPEVDELIRKGVLHDVQHTVFGLKRYVR